MVPLGYSVDKLENELISQEYIYSVVAYKIELAGVRKIIQNKLALRAIRVVGAQKRSL